MNWKYKYKDNGVVDWQHWIVAGEDFGKGRRKLGESTRKRILKKRIACRQCGHTKDLNENGICGDCYQAINA